MPRVAVTSRLFHLLPQAREELLAEYPDALIAEQLMWQEDELIEFLQGAPRLFLIGAGKVKGMAS